MKLSQAITLYGIKNCDTMKKARTWLDQRGVAYRFHDYKTEGVSSDLLRAWSEEAGWEKLLNRAGTTFRALPDADKTDLSADKAIRLMQANPSMIKRPVLVSPQGLLVGFDASRYEAVFGL